MLLYDILSMISYSCSQYYVRYHTHCLQHVRGHSMNIARGCAASKCAWKPWHPRRFSRSGIDVTRRRRTRVRMDVFPGDVKRNKGISDLLPCLAGFPYVEPIRSYQIHDWMMLGLGDVVPTSRMWQCPIC